MLSLDDVDVRRILKLDLNVSGQNLSQFLEFVRSHFNLKAVSYYCPSFRGCSLTSPFLITTSARGDDQTQGGKTHVDAFIELGSRSVLPIDWARVSRLTPPDWMTGDAIPISSHHQGVTIPVRGPVNSLWGLFNAASADSDPVWAQRRYQLIKDLVHVAHYVHHRAHDLHGAEQTVDLDTITKRELEALEHSAEGKSPAEIARLMRISTETVKAHLDSARFKLQALNRVHAVTKAIRAGLIR